MASGALVKVVVTTYNRGEWLREAVASVLAQTYPTIHVAIVDDASTDGSSDVARELAATGEGRVSAVVKTVNRGVGDTVRRGIEAPPDAPFVAVLNDDDRWFPDKLTRQMQTMQADASTEIVGTEALVVDGGGQPTGELFSDLYGRFGPADLNDVLRQNHVCASSLLMRRDLAFRGARILPDVALVWDFYFLLLAATRAPIAVLPEPLTVFREAETGQHLQEDLMWRQMTEAREAVAASHPEFTQALGGPAAARRRLALEALDVAVRQARSGRWREFAWHSRHVVRQRQLRPAVWLGIHALRAVARQRSGA